MMKKQLFTSSLALLKLTLLLLTTTAVAKTRAPAPAPVSSSPPSPAPASSEVASSDAPSPSTAPDIISILKKSGDFSAFIRLLRTTQVNDRITKRLSDGSQGLTLFAPTDEAFSHLKPGVLNRLSDRDQVQLVLFHMLSSYFPLEQFQTSSNPLPTEAGDNANGDFPLNITTGSDTNQLNLTTGIDSGAVTKTVFSDGQLAVYAVDQVLLPAQIFKSLPSAFASPKRQQAADEEATASEVSSGGGRAHALLVHSIALILLWNLLIWCGLVSAL